MYEVAMQEREGRDENGIDGHRLRRDGLRIVSVGLISIRVDSGLWSKVFLDGLGARHALHRRQA